MPDFIVMQMSRANREKGYYVAKQFVTRSRWCLPRFQNGGLLATYHKLITKVVGICTNKLAQAGFIYSYYPSNLLIFNLKGNLKDQKSVTPSILLVWSLKRHYKSKHLNSMSSMNSWRLFSEDFFMKTFFSQMKWITRVRTWSIKISTE